MTTTTATAIDQEILALEKQYWDAMKSKDSTTAKRLSDDPSVLVNSQGIAEIDRETLAGMVKGAPYQLREYSIDDREVRVRSLTDDVVVIAYKVHEDLVVEGKPTTMEAFETSVWVHRDGKWVCALHTETLPGDPFGRR